MSQPVCLSLSSADVIIVRRFQVCLGRVFKSTCKDVPLTHWHADAKKQKRLRKKNKESRHLSLKAHKPATTRANQLA